MNFVHAIFLRYVFKRLKFLGNKDISQVVTLLFLALWHGMYSGYFMNFMLEFFIMKFEREVSMSMRMQLGRYVRACNHGNMAPCRQYMYVCWIRSSQCIYTVNQSSVTLMFKSTSQFQRRVLLGKLYFHHVHTILRRKSTSGWFKQQSLF